MNIDSPLLGVAGEIVKEEAKSFLASVLGEPAKALGGLLSDHINTRRFSNILKAAVKAKQQLAEAGMSPQEVPIKIIHPALEAASLEEDPDMQSIWANLLANAADPRQNNPVLPSFSSILHELTSRDAKFLTALYASAERQAAHHTLGIPGVAFSHEELLNIYTKAGLSQEPDLTNVSQQYWKDHEAELTTDIKNST